METLKEALGKYGTVNTCDGDDDFFTIDMKLDKCDGVGSVNGCLNLIQESIGDVYSHTKSCTITSDKLNIVLRAVK